MKILKEEGGEEEEEEEEELVRARVLHSTFTVSGPRKAPPSTNPPTFTPRFSSQALASGGPEFKKREIFVPSLGQWRPRAQKR